MEIGNKILDLRKQKGLSQEQLAEKLGVARQTISKWELGETSPDLAQARELSKVFNVSLDDITNNDIKNILITKADNTERLTKTVINILKIIFLAIVIIITILIFIVFCKDYFDVQPVASMQSIECVIDGKEYRYEVWMNNETSYHIDKLNTNDKYIDIDPAKYTNTEQIFKDIKTSVTSRGGTCR